MEITVCRNFSGIRKTLLILPVCLLAIIVLCLYHLKALSVDGYVQCQKDVFLNINHHLGVYPRIQLNLTQLGDGLIFLSFLSIFIVVASRIWEAFISALIVSAIFACGLKAAFGVPRPAAMIPADSFIIIGKKLCHCNSLPSGHSITFFTILTVVLFGFMPKQLLRRIMWCSMLIGMGIIVVFTRVGVGAHYPLDVIIGSIVGYLSGLLGIFISQRTGTWNWIRNKKYYPVLGVILIVSCGILIGKIINLNLLIFYLALISVLITLYKIIGTYVKNIKE